MLLLSADGGGVRFPYDLVYGILDEFSVRIDSRVRKKKPKEFGDLFTFVFSHFVCAIRIELAREKKGVRV